MNLKNCKSCGKLYAYDGKPICPVCRKKDEEDFKIVKKYLEENPKADIKTISEDTEISTKRINRYLRQGRLEFSKATHSLLKCQRCGTNIKSGRFCNSCLKKMKTSFGVAKNSSNKKKKPAMYRNKSIRGKN